jgi:hypothetical protein
LKWVGIGGIRESSKRSVSVVLVVRECCIGFELSG